MSAPITERRAIAVRGIVQGVGFRPFIHDLAREHGLAGLVRNDADGVQIEVEGASDELDAFLHGITAGAPPLALVETVDWQPLATRDERGFRIEASRPGSQRRALVSPDVAVCEACLSELRDPADRRHRYPFINCTNCGPRFTITMTVPYDRATSTMAGFTMCPDCHREYDDPGDRRFHAQPTACAVCGPRVWLVESSGYTARALTPQPPSPVEDGRGRLVPRVRDGFPSPLPEGTGRRVPSGRGGAGDEGRTPHRRSVLELGPDPIARAAHMLLDGAVLAIKGLGGYHLACNPFDRNAVRALRERKVRQDKPFAIMALDLNQARELCQVSADEADLLTAPARPIVLLERRADSGVAEDVAPRQTTLGVMLAYTPLHHLVLHDAGIPLVMTSGNRSDEPIAYRDEEALEQLGGIADAFLIHDRPIHMRCDDSVTRVFAGQPYPLRRSRGYAPAPLGVAEPFGRHILACGGELKNTFCLAKERHAFLSHHIGDLENYETLRSFEEGIFHYRRLFDVRPELVAYDLHPEYLATKYARDLEETGLPVIGIQHHHAHIAACLADNERPSAERVIGVALDGTGYGTDGAIWGGEFFTGSLDEGFVRRAHLAYAPLPGGEAAIRQPWRGAIARLIALFGEEETLALPLAAVRHAGERNVRSIARLIEHGLNTPRTSSAGRLFDAIAALLGVPGTTRTTYEGQAAIELELLAAKASRTIGSYPLQLSRASNGWVIENGEILDGVVADLIAGETPVEIAARFHCTMAEVVATVCARIREGDGLNAVALSGGVFQNTILLRLTTMLLHEASFTVYIHRRVPANDGGLAFGQAVLADRAIRHAAA